MLLVLFILSIFVLYDRNTDYARCNKFKAEL